MLISFFLCCSFCLILDRANCARDYVKKENLSQWDGIVVVSGDGLLFEVSYSVVL